MKTITWLDLRLGFERQPAVAMLLGIVLALIAVLLTHPPQMAHQTAASEYEAGRVKAAEHSFRAALLAPSALAAAQQAVLAAAAGAGLQVGAVEYGQEANPDGRFGISTMRFSVAGSYPDMRRFVDEMLAAQPALSLRHLGIEQERGGSASSLRASLTIQFLIGEEVR